MFIHCKKCIDEVPLGKSPRDFVNNEIEIKHDGYLYITCVRHNLPIVRLPLNVKAAIVQKVMMMGCSCPTCKTNEPEG